MLPGQALRVVSFSVIASAVLTFRGVDVSQLAGGLARSCHFSSWPALSHFRRQCDSGLCTFSFQSKHLERAHHLFLTLSQLDRCDNQIRSSCVVPQEQNTKLAAVASGNTGHREDRQCLRSPEPALLSLSFSRGSLSSSPQFYFLSEQGLGQDILVL